MLYRNLCRLISPGTRIRFRGKSRRKHFFFSLPIIFSLFLVFPSGFSQSGQKNSQQDISEYQKRLNQIAAEKDGLKKKINSLEKKKTSILSQLDSIGLKKKLIKNDIALYDLQKKRADKELSALTGQIPALKANLNKEKDSVEKVLVSMYKFGRPGYVEFLFQAEGMGNLLAEGKNLSLLAKHQEKKINEYMVMLTELKTAQKKLEDKKSEIDSIIQSTRQKEQEYVIQEKTGESLINEINQNKETHLKTLAELEERAEQLQNLMQKIMDEKITLPFPLIPLYEKKGKLEWPINGKVVTYFGTERHKRFNTKIKNNGIDIAPTREMVVKSVHQGLVAFSDYHQGYGNLIIIEHGMGYHSLYGHCSALFVKKGDAIEAQQPIATVGDLGSLKGNTLHFEIRHKIKPLNPLQWLKRR